MSNERYKIKIVKVDFNGTIINDWKSAHAGMAKIFETYGVPPPTMVEFIHEVGVTGDFFAFYLNHGIQASQDTFYSIFIPAYRKAQLNATIFPGLHDAFEAIVGAGIEIHLVTSARADLIIPLIEEVKIDSFLSASHFDVKSKQEVILKTVKKYNLHPYECVMVGDLPSDIIHAKNAKIRGIAFLNGDVPKEMFSELHTMDYATSSWQAIAEYITGER